MRLFLLSFFSCASALNLGPPASLNICRQRSNPNVRDHVGIQINPVADVTTKTIQTSAQYWAAHYKQKALEDKLHAIYTKSVVQMHIGGKSPCLKKLEMYGGGTLAAILINAGFFILVLFPFNNIDAFVQDRDARIGFFFLGLTSMIIGCMLAVNAYRAGQNEWVRNREALSDKTNTPISVIHSA